MLFLIPRVFLVDGYKELEKAAEIGQAKAETVKVKLKALPPSQAQEAGFKQFDRAPRRSQWTWGGNRRDIFGQ
jgi:hypothetical protein